MLSLPVDSPPIPIPIPTHACTGLHHGRLPRGDGAARPSKFPGQRAELADEGAQELPGSSQGLFLFVFVCV